MAARAAAAALVTVSHRPRGVAVLTLNHAPQLNALSVALGDKVWIQKPQKYHARSLGMFRAKYAAIADKRELDLILAAAGCLAGLRA